MMSTIVFCNIGNSDLQADGQRPQRPRPDGERLWHSFVDHTFDLPIIEPCLGYLLDDGIVVDQLVLFYTDQPATSQTQAFDRYGVSLRDKDTLWYARIAERRIREQFGARIATIELLRVERGNGQAINPSLYDEAFDAYGSLIARTYSSRIMACYVLMAGGIPACNVALQIQAISAYAGRCQFLYQPEGGIPYQLRVGTQIQATFRRATALEALERRDFATALLNVAALEQPDQALIALLQYACYREAFDFSRAQKVLVAGIRAASGELRTILASIKPELEQLIERTDMAALLREVAASARMTFDNGRYADFLGRVFRFQEATLRYLVELYLGLPTDMGSGVKEANLAQFLAQIEASPVLKATLDAQHISGKPLRYTEGPNREVMNAMLTFLADGGTRADGQPYLNKADKGRIGEVRRCLNKINTLAQLRNQSIIAHGFAGVSREELANTYGNDATGVIQDIEKIVDLLGLARTESPFARIAQLAADILRRSS